MGATKPDLRPALPIPDLSLLLSRFGDTAAPFVSAELLSAYKAAIATVFTPEQARAILDSLEEKDTNWSNAWFIKLVLSVRLAVATTNLFIILADIPGATRVRKLAALLRAVGVWSREYVFSARSGGESRYTPAQELLEWQLRGLCATFRVPKDLDTCAIEHADPGEARHAVVWCGGAAWRVEVVNEQGTVLPVVEIERQLLEILKVRIEKQLYISALPRVAALSWRPDRPGWHVRKTALEQVPGNAAHFSTLYSALVTVALEEHPAPADVSERLDDVRMGKTSENRFADQTFGIVSYSDGSTGLVFDHAPSDCGAALELITLLLSIINAPAPAEQTSVNTTTTTTAAAPHLLDFTDTPQPQPCPASLIESIPRTVITLTIPPPTTGIPRPHVSTRLTDTVVNLALQAAVSRTTGTVAPMFQPVQLKRFYGGRPDSMVPISHESLAFAQLVVAATTTSGAHATDAAALQHAFAAAYKRRRQIIGETLDGKTTKFFRQGYVHPALRSLAASPAVPQTPGLSAVLAVFDTVSGLCVGGGLRVLASIQFTGFTSTTDDIYAGLSNIFLHNQLAVFYMQRPGGTLEVSFSATGDYCSELPALVSCYRECYEVVAGVADVYGRSVA